MMSFKGDAIYGYEINLYTKKYSRIYNLKSPNTSMT